MHTFNVLKLKKQLTGKRLGVAYLMVITALSVLSIIAYDFQYNAFLDTTLAYNARDELIAYYNAKSALEIQLAVLRTMRQSQAVIGQLMPNVPITQFLKFAPITCSAMKQVMTLAEGGQPLKITGECHAQAVSEKSKIDINRMSTLSDKQRIQGLLLARLLDPRYDHFFEEENAAGQKVTREELVSYISDYTDSDNTREGTTAADEDDIYSRLKDRYKVKNAPFDSLDELQLVFGIDDALFLSLQPSLTVYPVGGVNLAEASYDTIAAIIRQAAKDPNNPMLYGEPMIKLFESIQEVRLLPFSGATLNRSVLANLAQSAGISVDEKKLSEMIDDNQSLDWFMIESEGQVNNVTRKIKTAYNLSNNQLVYYREE